MVHHFFDVELRIFLVDDAVSDSGGVVLYRPQHRTLQLLDPHISSGEARPELTVKLRTLNA